MKLEEIQKITKKAIVVKETSEKQEVKKKLQDRINAIVSQIEKAMKEAAIRCEWEARVSLGDDEPDSEIVKALNERYKGFKTEISEGDHDQRTFWINWELKS